MSLRHNPESRSEAYLPCGALGIWTSWISSGEVKLVTTADRSRSVAADAVVRAQQDLEYV
jgi:hypothetical protein